MEENNSLYTVDEVYQEVQLLRDLFARRLMDDKVKGAAIEKLSQSNSELIKTMEDNQILSFVKELILICDRIYNQPVEDVFAYSILDEILEVLARREIEQISQLDVFDPKIHNSVSVVDANEETPANAIVTVVRHGYIRRDKVIRPADVIVAIEK